MTVSSGARRLLAPAATATVVLGWTAALRLRDPHVAGSWGSCPFLALTGLPCPVCGGLRAVNSLTHGDVVAALSSNLLVVALVPVALVWWGLWLRRCLAAAGTPRTALTVLPVPSRRTVLVATAVVAAFTVLRWLPAGAWLYP